MCCNGKVSLNYFVVVYVAIFFWTKVQIDEAGQSL
jgi:hypothetical protein